jgi:hypothetical protein
LGSRAIRKCLNCGSGVFVKTLPPRYKPIPPAMWDEMERQWEEMHAPGGDLSTEQIEADIARSRELSNGDE